MNNKYLAEHTLLNNRYVVIKVLGIGGMGVVYEARDSLLSSRVALKQAVCVDGNSQKYFETEVCLLANLQHPGLPRVTDRFTDAHGQFLVMDLIEGPDLKSLLEEKKQPFSHEEVLDWGEQLLDVLRYLHSRQPPVFHRDIKPQNLKLKNSEIVTLLDFGLATGAPSYMTSMVAGNSIQGLTPEYAPLEQLLRFSYFMHRVASRLNAAQVDEIMSERTDGRTDLYSLAATMYHLMTGVIPINAIDRFLATLHGEPDPLPLANQVCPNVPSQVANFLLHAMAIRRKNRFDSAEAMKKELQDIMRSARIARYSQDELSTLPLINHQTNEDRRDIHGTKPSETTWEICSDEIEKTQNKDAPAQFLPKIWKLKPIKGEGR